MNENNALEIYKIIRGEESNWLHLHRQYSQQYTTIIVILMGASLGAIYQFMGNPWLMLAVLIAPGLNILLCKTAIRMCNRFYQRFLEGITIQAKLEHIIGLTSPRQYAADKSKFIPFPEDKNILPERWLNSRYQRKSKDFVQENMRSGSNRFVRWSFYLLLFANAVLAIGIVFGTILAFIHDP